MLIDSIKDVRHVEEKIFDAIKASPAPVSLWGAGEIVWYILMYLRSQGIQPIGIFDNNPLKHGTKHIGLPVYTYENFKKLAGNEDKYQIVIATGPQYRDAIFRQLVKEGEKNPIWYLRGYEVCGEKINYQYIQENINLFEEAYNYLSDDVSKKVFVNVIKAKLSGDFSLYTEIMSEGEFFDIDIIRILENELLLDVGAHKGATIVEFARRTNGKYDGIIALEPDKKTLASLEETIAHHGISGVEVYNKGAWDRHAFLNFHDGREGSSRVAETSAVSYQSAHIEVDAIDNILQGRRVTYISMDIEGAEHNAILGAEQTIKKWKPKMGVCVYHKREDLFDLLLLLKSFVPEYKFYMRHYTDNQTETVLYAV